MLAIGSGTVLASKGSLALAHELCGPLSASGWRLGCFAGTAGPTGKFLLATSTAQVGQSDGRPAGRGVARAWTVKHEERLGNLPGRAYQARREKG